MGFDKRLRLLRQGEREAVEVSLGRFGGRHLYWEKVFRGYLSLRAGSPGDNVGTKRTNFRDEEVHESVIGSAQLGVVGRDYKEWNVSSVNNFKCHGNAGWGLQEISGGSS